MMAMSAVAAAAYLAAVESNDCLRKLSIPAAITNSGSEAITNSSAGSAAARNARAVPIRPGATTAFAISNPAAEQRFTASSSGIP